MKRESVELSILGRFRTVPAVIINGTIIVVTGGFVKTAAIKDEFWLESDCIGNPEDIIKALKKSTPRADIFNFSQKLPNVQPSYKYYHEPYSIAAIPTTSYNDWWEDRLSQVTRKNVRRASRRGTVVKRVEFDDELVKGIVAINNETPVRQGRRFWHYGKDFESVKKDYSDFLDKSDFLGAYFEGELIGLLRLIYTKDAASIMQLLCMNKHYDKRPANALMAKAVERCCDKSLGYLVYGQYVYGENIDSPLTEFKRRNGFEQFFVPSYYVPLSLKGNIIIKLHMHMGIKRRVPNRAMNLARRIRAKWQSRATKKTNGGVDEDSDKILEA